MSIGTDIIQEALQKIGVHSSVSPADPESIVLGMNNLNSMLEMWLSDNIKMGFTPLSVPGDELNEPPDCRNGIISNLAIQVAPDFDNGKQIVSVDLKNNASSQFKQIKRIYYTVTIPKKVVSGTLPIGAGNSKGVLRRAFFGGGATLNDTN